MRPDRDAVNAVTSFLLRAVLYMVAGLGAGVLVASACGCASERANLTIGRGYTPKQVESALVDPFTADAKKVFGKVDLRELPPGTTIMVTDSILTNESAWVGCAWMSSLRTLVCGSAAEIASRIGDAMLDEAPGKKESL